MSLVRMSHYHQGLLVVNSPLQQCVPYVIQQIHQYDALP